MTVCVISGVIKDSRASGLQVLSASFEQACEFYVCNAEWLTPVPGLGPEICHDRGLAVLLFSLATSESVNHDVIVLV
jgi:hypothetical protein